MKKNCLYTYLYKYIDMLMVTYYHYYCSICGLICDVFKYHSNSARRVVL